MTTFCCVGRPSPYRFRVLAVPLLMGLSVHFTTWLCLQHLLEAATQVASLLFLGAGTSILMTMLGCRDVREVLPESGKDAHTDMHMI